MNPLALLKKTPTFQSLDQPELDFLIEQGEVEEVKKGGTLFRAGTPAKHAYIGLIGSLKLIRLHPDGKERIVHVLLPGEVFGAAVALHQGEYPVSVRALEHSRVLKFEKTVFQQALLTHPTIGQLLIQQMSQRIQQAHQDEVMIYDAVEKRMGVFLLDLLQRMEARIGKTSRIPVPLTRQDIADRIGSTVETVIRVLSRWSKEDLIRSHGRHLEIPDLRRLQDTLQIDVETHVSS